MKYIRLFENRQIWYNIFFNPFETQRLKDIHFKVKDYQAEYNSASSDLKMSIKKFAEEVSKGKAELYFTLEKNDSIILKGDFEKVINLAKENVPEVDIVSKKYNL